MLQKLMLFAVLKTGLFDILKIVAYFLLLSKKMTGDLKWKKYWTSGNPKWSDARLNSIKICRENVKRN